MEFGTKMRLRRDSLGISQAKLAKTIGVCTRTIQRYEEGTSKPNGVKLAELEKALSINLREGDIDYDTRYNL